jgi:formylglycine-generating enzyme required for sulfatase activity
MAQPQSETRSIKILEKTYQLPILGGKDLQRLQGEIQARQDAIKSGEAIVRSEQTVEVGGLFGLGKRTERRVVKRRQKLDVEQRFRTLELQIRDYKQLMGLLQRHKVDYQRFFGQLSQEIGQVIGRKCEKIAALEQKRAALEERQRPKQNQAVLQAIQQQKHQLLDSLVMMDKAAVLMLKKIDLISEGIQKLTDDNQLQQQLLARLMAELKDYKEVYELQQEIQQVQAEIAEMTEVALNFEQYLRDYLGPFQALIADAAQVDGDLARTVEEIKNLAEELMGSEGFFSLANSEEISESILNFQVAGAQRQYRIEEALEDAQSQGPAANFRASQLSDQAVAAISVSDCIATIQDHVAQRLQQVQSLVTVEVEAIDSSEFDLGVSTGTGTELERLDLGNGVELVLVSVPAGRFWMGSEQYDTEKPVHEVALPGFLMGETPVTQAQYQAVMGQNPAHFQGDLHRPVESVSWANAMAFCQTLSQQTGRRVHLPSEAEWEYACRAGSQMAYCFGNDESQLRDYAWYGESSSKGSTHPVRQKKANAWGLYDMHGNVWEWCGDDWHRSYKGKPKQLKEDGTVTWLSSDKPAAKLLRGGSWGLNSRNCRCAQRGRVQQDKRRHNIGFRVAIFLS